MAATDPLRDDAPTPSMPQRWALLHQRGRARRGAVDVRDADAVELPRRTYQRRVGGETWDGLPGTNVRFLPGVDPDDPTVRAAAALLAIGDHAVVSHGTAAWLHGLLPNAPTTVHVTVPVNRDPRPGVDAPIRVVRSRTLLVQDVVAVDGIRATTVDRTLGDLSAIVDDRRMLDLMTMAEQRRLVALDTLVAQAGRSGTAAGSARFRRMVEVRRRDRTDSGLERDTADLCRAHGFTPHPGPYPVRCGDGRTVHLDVAFPALRFAIECDGVGFHSDADSVRRDRRRWRWIQAAGWRITWVTRADLLRDPDEIVAIVREAHQAGS